MLDIREDDLTHPQIRALLALHLRGMRATSPAESVFALDLSGLRAPDITVWTAWIGDNIAGVAALRALAPNHGEIKSMRTHPDHLRKGVAAALLRHIVAQASGRGMARLSLETGSGAAFEPALALYRAHGFENGPAFGDYTASAFNQFLHRRC
ncbi:GNAT family N-acetyltransferase [Sphingobium ummariense]